MRWMPILKRTRRIVVSTATLVVLITACGSAGAADPQPLTGKKTEWRGFDRFDFEVGGKPVLVVAPKEAAVGRPWMWHGEFHGHLAEPDLSLLKRGFHIAYIRVPDMFGSPTAVGHWNDFYKHLTEKHGFARKVALYGISRGGLYCYNWAAENPDKVACIIGDAPVCNLRSWPLSAQPGGGNKGEIPKIFRAYGVDSEKDLLAKAWNPIDRLAPIAKAKVPLLHVYGDVDKPVPWEENTGIIAERYKKLGGSIELIAKPGIGHVHGLPDPRPLAEFVLKHAGAGGK